MEPRKIAENSIKPLICMAFMDVKTLPETRLEIREKLWTTFRRGVRGRLVHTLSAGLPQPPVGNRRDPPDIHSSTRRQEHGPVGPGRRYPQHRCERYRASRGCAAGEWKMLRPGIGRPTNRGVCRRPPDAVRARGAGNGGCAASVARSRIVALARRAAPPPPSTAPPGRVPSPVPAPAPAPTGIPEARPALRAPREAPSPAPAAPSRRRFRRQRCLPRAAVAASSGVAGETSATDATPAIRAETATGFGKRSTRQRCRA
jgi:hypothetical protein